jgi:aspartate-semialdehyde dehydrogenase
MKGGSSLERKAAYNIAILGATGAVGRKMIETLERRAFPVAQLLPLASARSAGASLSFGGQEWTVEEVSEDAFSGIDIALFSAGAATSREWAPTAVAKGAIVIDNSSAYRMEDGVPLVVPEVNSHAIAQQRGIIANPNCSTIQLMVAVNPLRDLGITRIAVSTYQAVSGMGQKAVDGLKAEMAAHADGDVGEVSVFPLASGVERLPMAYNVLAQCDVFLDNGYTREEMKMVGESRKILEMPNLSVSPTAVRVPVVYGHSEAVEIEFSSPVTAAEVRERLSRAPGVVVVDDPERGLFPHPKMAEGTGDTFVGRIRPALDRDNTILMFVVADNLLKGAAWNAVQIAECLIQA